MRYKDAIEEIANRLQDDEERMAFGEEAVKIDLAIALTFARQERGLTQQQLADMVGVSRAYIARLETGEANPSISKAGRIFAALWLAPIDRPSPLLQGYGPYESGSATTPETLPAPAAPGKPTRKDTRNSHAH